MADPKIIGSIPSIRYTLKDAPVYDDLPSLPFELFNVPTPTPKETEELCWNLIDIIEADLPYVTDVDPEIRTRIARLKSVDFSVVFPEGRHSFITVWVEYSTHSEFVYLDRKFCLNYQAFSRVDVTAPRVDFSIRPLLGWQDDFQVHIKAQDKSGREAIEIIYGNPST